MLNQMLKSPRAEALKREFRIKEVKPLTPNNFCKHVYVSSKIHTAI